MELPRIVEVDAWEAVEDLEAGAAARGGVPAWSQLKDSSRTEAGVSRPATVSAVAAILLVLAMLHGIGALGTLSLGLEGNGVGSAIVVGILALVIGVGEIVCAVQVTQGKSWARATVIALGCLMLVWLTMAPWHPGLLTVAIFAAWVAVGALLAHPLTSRYFAELD
jgi:hypothetical protein